MRLPNFFVVGAARSGTTSLHYYLAEHPDIAMSRIKEPNHFLFSPGPRPLSCIDDARIEAKSVPDRQQYERLFATGTRAAGEASPLYLYTRESPELIAAAVPDARIIAIVREPVARAWSHYVYVHGDGDDRDATMRAFEAAVERELPLGYTPYRTGTHFVRLGKYAEQLRRYRDCFPRERLLVLSYDDLDQPAATLARICRFLDVDETFAFDTTVQFNPSSGDRSWFARVDAAVRPAYPYLKRALPARISGALAARRARLRAAHGGRAGVTFPAALRERLADYFRADLDWLAAEESIRFT